MELPNGRKHALSMKDPLPTIDSWRRGSESDHARPVAPACKEKRSALDFAAALALARVLARASVVARLAAAVALAAVGDAGDSESKSPLENMGCRIAEPADPVRAAIRHFLFHRRRLIPAATRCIANPLPP